MQDVLPVGLAVLERARQGGPGKVVEAFTAGSEDPIADLLQTLRRIEDRLEELRRRLPASQG